MPISKLFLISLFCASAFLAGCTGDSKNIDRDERVDSISSHSSVQIDSTLPRENVPEGDSGSQHPPKEKQEEPQYPSREWQIKQKLEWQKKHPELIMGPPDVDTLKKK